MSTVEYISSDDTQSSIRREAWKELVEDMKWRYLWALIGLYAVVSLACSFGPERTYHQFGVSSWSDMYVLSLQIWGGVFAIGVPIYLLFCYGMTCIDVNIERRRQLQMSEAIAAHKSKG